MTLTDIQNLIALDECETVELKKSTGQRTAAAKTVCGMLYRAGVIEQWGTGTTRIAEMCRTNGNPPPD